MSGISSASARALAAVSPTTRAPTSPGRVATATAPRSAERDAGRGAGLRRSSARSGGRARATRSRARRRHSAGADRLARRRRWSESVARPCAAAADLPVPPRPSRRTSSRWPEGSIRRDRVTFWTVGSGRAASGELDESSPVTTHDSLARSHAALLASASLARMTSSALSSCLSTNVPAGTCGDFGVAAALFLSSPGLSCLRSFPRLLASASRRWPAWFSRSRKRARASCDVPWRRNPGRA